MGKKEKQQRKEMQPEHRRKLFLFGGILLLIVVVVCVGTTIWWTMNKNQQAAEAAAVEENNKSEAIKDEKEKEQEQADAAKEDVLSFSLESGLSVFDALDKRPPSEELESGNENEFADILSCLVDGESSIIELALQADAIPKSDDKYYYLFALRSYEESIPEDRSYLIQEYKDLEVNFRFPRYFASNNNGLYHKFIVAVKKDGKYVPVSNMHYTTNIGDVAKYRSNGSNPTSKKGLLIDPSKIRTTELEDLGVAQAAYNIPVSRILGESTDGTYPTIHFTYNGKTYSFNGQVMSEYDLVFSTLTKKGITTSAIILNDIDYAYPQLIHPKSRLGLGSAPYYAFNASDEEGTDLLAAIGVFLAERYSGTANGRGMVSNWIIGNEINARKEWNYMEHVDLKTYVREYAKAFRIFYNAIKSVNSASNIYISLDQQWNVDFSGSNYKTKEVLDEFNRLIKEEGNIDWGLAIHPYNVPLTTPKIWQSSKYVKNSIDTPAISMANLNVVTDYLEKEELLTADGEVRSVTLSELGYTSTQGEEVQAAAIVYAFKVADANLHVDAILLSRESDAPEEVAQSLALGLNHVGGGHKYSWNVYRYMDTDQAEEYTSFAKSIIGISDWSEILK